MSSRACQECHRKKTKCDMVRPTCGLCQRTGNVCEFPTKRKPPSKKGKRQTSSLSQFEGNLNRLLNLLEHQDVPSLTRDCNAPADTRQESENENVESLQDVVSLSESHVSSVLDGVTTEVRLESSYDQAQGFQQEILQQHNGQSQTMQAVAQQIAEGGESTFDQQNSISSATCQLVSHDLAMELVETFFGHIQPWLPILHKPRFVTNCTNILQRGSNALSGLSPEMSLLLNSVFALSARHCQSPSLASMEPTERPMRFFNAAHQAYCLARATETPSLIYLQGCILLAFLAYTTELNSQAWILTGVCVRLAYDMDLSEIDDDASELNDDNDPVRTEELRRAWWLVWELDTFGSIISRRPFSVDRDDFSVKLPISDEDWFCGKIGRSSILLTPPDQAWRSLKDSDNQEPRAWFLVANHLLSTVYKHLQSRHNANGRNKHDFEVIFNCLKLSLPSTFNILTNPPQFEPNTFASCNWIIGTHLLIITACHMVETMAFDCNLGTSPISSSSQCTDVANRMRAISLSQLISRWPVDYVTAAHPFFMGMLLPVSQQSKREGPHSVIEDSGNFHTVSQLAELIMMRFAEKWKLASAFLAVLELLRGPEAATHVDATLKRFAYYFPRSKRVFKPRPINQAQARDDDLGYDWRESVPIQNTSSSSIERRRTNAENADYNSLEPGQHPSCGETQMYGLSPLPPIPHLMFLEDNLANPMDMFSATHSF